MWYYSIQAYKLIVVQTKAGLDKTSKPEFIYGAPTAIIVCEDKFRAWINPYNGRQLISRDVRSNRFRHRKSMDLFS